MFACNVLSWTFLCRPDWPGLQRFASTKTPIIYVHLKNGVIINKDTAVMMFWCQPLPELSYSHGCLNNTRISRSSALWSHVWCGEGLTIARWTHTYTQEKLIKRVFNDDSLPVLKFCYAVELDILANMLAYIDHSVHINIENDDGNTIPTPTAECRLVLE